jgi:hypothetical protein
VIQFKILAAKIRSDLSSRQDATLTMNPEPSTVGQLPAFFDFLLFRVV